MTTKRASLTPQERTAMHEAQGGLCAACGKPTPLKAMDADHTIPVDFLNDQKPDCLLCKPCHKAKTAQDIKAIAKGRRIRRKATGTWRPNRKKIQSRGFDKRLTRKMDGTVEDRN